MFLFRKTESPLLSPFSDKSFRQGLKVIKRKKEKPLLSARPKMAGWRTPAKRPLHKSGLPFLYSLFLISFINRRSALTQILSTF